jgi:glycosyltransferase involved in cell wall biosynthesis
MRILYISLHLLTRKVSSGGDHIFLETAIRWSKKGHELTLLVPEISAGEFKEKIPNAQLITINPSWLEKGESYNRWFFLVFPIYLLRTFQALKMINKSGLYDVVTTNGDFFCNVIPASKLKNTKWMSFIYHINESPFKRKGNSFLMSCVSFLMQRFSFRVIKKKANTVILLNNQVKDDLVTQGFNGKKLKVAGCGINYKQIQQYPPQAEMSYDVCALGRIYPTKGVFDLPAIWEKIVQSKPSAKLAIIGTGPESWTEELKKLIEQKGLMENIHMLGFVNTDKVYGLLKSAKVFVTASYEEGWGISVCEAMACGLPVVAYDLPAFKEVFGDSVELVPRGNTSLMAEKILYYLENDDIRNQKKNSVRNLASRFDWDTISEEYLNSIRTGN